MSVEFAVTLEAGPTEMTQAQLRLHRVSPYMSAQGLLAGIAGPTHVAAVLLVGGVYCLRVGRQGALRGEGFRAHLAGEDF